MGSNHLKFLLEVLRLNTSQGPLSTLSIVITINCILRITQTTHQEKFMDTKLDKVYVTFISVRTFRVSYFISIAVFVLLKYQDQLPFWLAKVFVGEF